MRPKSHQKADKNRQEIKGFKHYAGNPVGLLPASLMQEVLMHLLNTRQAPAGAAVKGAEQVITSLDGLPTGGCYKKGCPVKDSL